MSTPETLERGQRLSADDLRQMVGPDQHRPGPDWWRLIEAGIPVWAIIGYTLIIGGPDVDPLDSTPETVAQVAADYRISTDQVRAALLYYGEHRAAIDTVLAVNAAHVN